MSERVTISVANHIADVRFNRPDKMNALDTEQIDAIVAAGEKLAAMEGIRAIVLSGEGRAFCAGLDMGNFAASAAAASSSTTEPTKRPPRRPRQRGAGTIHTGKVGCREWCEGV